MAMVMGLLPPHAGAQKCAEPNETKRRQVEDYVIARYKLSSTADVILTESKAANEACFWLFRYEASNPKREVAIYLSPDGHYLLPALYDLRIDPKAEENQAREQNAKSLLAGISPEFGSKDAPVTIVEFADFECPYCKRMADTIKKDFLPGESSRVRFLFKQFPLPMHRWAMAAAEMTECVSLQKPSEFWKLHDYIFENQAQLTEANLKEKATRFVAANVAIDQAQFQFCVDNDLAMGLVKKDMELGQRLGIRGTPAIFVNGILYPGLKDGAWLRTIVELAAKGGELPASAPSSSVVSDNTSVPRAFCGGTPAPSQR